MFKLFLLSVVWYSFIQITEPKVLEQVTEGLREGQGVWVAGDLSDSYENQVLSLMGLPVRGRSVEGYRHLFQQFGLKVEYVEIKREMYQFPTLEELRTWIKTQVDDLSFVEPYLAAMQQIGCVQLEDGTIAFPTKHVIAYIHK
ncbi:MAG: hypothetical protein Q8L98_02430 [Chlamydiales bacterium]|nr:hypothetical protein [Chlamydiales bacterium]